MTEKCEIVLKIENGKAVLHGVVSWNLEFEEGKCYHSPGIYANVYSVMDFIEDVIVSS